MLGEVRTRVQLRRGVHGHRATLAETRAPLGDTESEWFIEAVRPRCNRPGDPRLVRRREEDLVVPLGEQHGHRPTDDLERFVLGVGHVDRPVELFDETSAGARLLERGVHVVPPAALLREQVEERSGERYVGDHGEASTDGSSCDEHGEKRRFGSEREDDRRDPERAHGGGADK